MKHYLMSAIGLFLFSALSFAQKIEISFQPQSGFFYFGGKSAQREQPYIVYDTYIGLNYRHGKIPGKAFSLEGAAKRIDRKNWIQGLAFAYESLQDKSNINKVNGMSGNNQVIGYTTWTNTFLTGFPFAGKRFIHKNFYADLIAGADISFSLNCTEKGYFKGTTGNPYSWEEEIGRPKVDFRPRVQLTAGYKNIGILAGYSQGVTNYYKSIYPKSEGFEAFSRFIRLGIFYRFQFKKGF